MIRRTLPGYPARKFYELGGSADLLNTMLSNYCPMLEPMAKSLDAQPPEVSSLLTEADWRAAASVMQVLRPSLQVEKFVSRREQLLADGYCLLGVRVGDLVVSIASYTISPHVAYGRELLVHDMATLSEAQGRGYASELISELVSIAERQSCGRIFVHTRHAQSFYTRNGFSEHSTGLARKIKG